MKKVIFILVLLFNPAGAVASSEKVPSPKKLGLQTAYLGASSLAVMSLLWALPADQSQWYDKPTLAPTYMFSRWKENIAKGPVWDGDMRFFNGYGHIHTGAAYTVMCLNSGYSNQFCTLYANFMSFAWEYGPEAIVEIPSYQDLLMTGLIGARVGIQFYEWGKAIEANHKKVMGSRVLGGVALFLLNPFGMMYSALPGVEIDDSEKLVSIPMLNKTNSGHWLFGYQVFYPIK